MASKTLLFILGVTLIAVAYGAWVVEEEEHADLTEEGFTEEELTVEDLMEYFTQMEKRGKGGRGVGKCRRPDGKQCDICNLKIRNKNDMRRYIACGSAGKGRRI